MSSKLKIPYEIKIRDKVLDSFIKKMSSYFLCMLVIISSFKLYE